MWWEVLLTNGEIRHNTDFTSMVSAWRELYNYCQKNKLKIKEFKVNDRIIDKNAIKYCIYYDVLAFMRTPEQYSKQAIAALRSNGKIRIAWHSPQTGDVLYNEVSEEENLIMEDVGIEHE
jgi:hypothetical protein